MLILTLFPELFWFNTFSWTLYLYGPNKRIIVDAPNGIKFLVVNGFFCFKLYVAICHFSFPVQTLLLVLAHVYCYSFKLNKFHFEFFIMTLQSKNLLINSFSSIQFNLLLTGMKILKGLTNIRFVIKYLYFP
jgi:hypothetical protein